jgi:hypothetical protein
MKRANSGHWGWGGPLCGPGSRKNTPLPQSGLHNTDYNTVAYAAYILYIHIHIYTYIHIYIYIYIYIHIYIYIYIYIYMLCVYYLRRDSSYVCPWIISYILFLSYLHP